MFSDSSAQQTARQSVQKVIRAGITDGELQTLARSPEVKVRAAVAEHAGTPLMTLLRLAEDRSADVRIGLARNRRESIPIEVREDLAKDRNVDVVYALIDNPAVPDALIARLGRQLHKEYAKAARARIAAVKAGTWAPSALPAPVLPAGEDEVPSFATVDAPVERTPRPAAPSPSARADALDVLLGNKR
ncbi:hypothetical protein [Demequina rhizosphaerae]|uniref:hypothetical protein n=1 Tax=Demequina rhizosphaerae TaxID=1638985 RepID=UPI000780F960|nr:hypothetical protein [Demequina rhizosphaerae]